MSHLPKRGEIGTKATTFEASGAFDEKPAKTKPTISPDEMEKVDAAIIDQDEEARADARLSRRQAKIGHPGKLEGSEAETFVEKKKVELSVDAIVELEYALKYGSEGARERARDRILDATGHGKKDKVHGGANLIIVNMGGGAGGPTVNLPPLLKTPMALTSGSSKP